jgi:hypothetical protein
VTAGWEYSMLSLTANGDGNWTGWLIIDGQATDVAVRGYRERVAILNNLGKEGWEIIGQSANGSGNGDERSFVYGWEWTLKRPL